MKLTDEQREAMDYLTGLLDEIERLKQEVTTWNEAAETQKENNLSLAMEVKRLKEENERLRGLYERERNIAEQAQREVERLRGEYAKLGNALVQAQYHLSKEQYMSAEDVVNEAIQEGIQG